jgi:RNA polymerase sigma-70 factor (ECF subfamily)
VLAALPESLRGAMLTEPALATWLAAELSRAIEPWPHLASSLPHFIEHLFTVTDDADELRRGNLEAWRALRLTELFHAWACVQKDLVAIATFESEYFEQIDRTLARMKVDVAQAEDLRSALREALFFGRHDVPPALAGYSGRSGLRSWTRSVAVHAVLNARRQVNREVGLDESSLDVVGPEVDPELSYLKRRYAPEFQRALGEAFGQLGTRERNLLRMYYLDGLTIDAIGRLYGVHRATAARHVVDAREGLLTKMRASLATKLGLGTSEFDNLLALIRSQLHLTLKRLLP